MEIFHKSSQFQANLCDKELEIVKRKPTFLCSTIHVDNPRV